MTMGTVDIPQSCASCSVDGRKIKLGIQWSKIKLNGFINDNMTKEITTVSTDIKYLLGYV